MRVLAREQGLPDFSKFITELTAKNMLLIFDPSLETGRLNGM